MSWLSRRSTTPPAFLEPHPQTTMDQQRDAIQLPRSHRLSLSSLSSISTEGSSEDEHSWANLDAKYDEEDNCNKQDQSSNSLSLPSISTALMCTGSGISNNRNEPTTAVNSTPRQSQTPHMDQQADNAPAIVNSHFPHADSADSQNIRLLGIGSLSPHSSTSVQGDDFQHHPTPPALQQSSSSLSSSSGSDSSSPSSPVPSSLSTFWASPSSINNEQRHHFVTKNAHIKRPRNAWIHFRCYFGQALKATDPTIRAEEISKRASEYWSRLTNKQKKPWHVMAEQEKLAHQEAFPDYRYRPKRALPKSVVLTYPASSSTCKLDQCSKKFRLA
ncbi:hypothetical protein BCR42DRAFT_424905 [Absidia repens]|uniref:HMG box domain-containing protein n=1 Tax=Absidia repens TaxID=90262 RepID=A0A1X2I332_9FUNG|nr:hypothetical protein BCR42DRAFT_424905 [Absidia repens]